MFKNLRNKFLFFNMVITSLLLLTAFCVVYLATYSNAKTENECKLDNVAKPFISSSGDSGGSGTLNDQNNPGLNPESKLSKQPNDEPRGELKGKLQGMTADKVTSDYALSFVVIVDQSGGLCEVCSLMDIERPLYIEAAQTAWHYKNTSPVTLAGRSWIYKIVPLQNDSIAAAVNLFQISFLDVTDTQKTMNTLLFTLGVVGMVMLAVIFLISLHYANRAIRPFAESWEKQEQFVADASHELKTPLGSIMVNCDVLAANKEKTIKSQKEWLSCIQRGADQMARLVNSLLTLARLEGVAFQMKKNTFDMAALLDEVMRSMNGMVVTKKLRVEHQFGFIGNIDGYERLVGQVLAILYDNAVKYTNEGGTIRVTLCQNKKGVFCTIGNTGKGIPARDLPRVFDRFFRCDAVRSSEEMSYGLGLSIARRITDEIEGKITVQSLEDEWTEFVFTFS